MGSWISNGQRGRLIVATVVAVMASAVAVLVEDLALKVRAPGRFAA